VIWLLITVLGGLIRVLFGLGALVLAGQAPGARRRRGLGRRSVGLRTPMRLLVAVILVGAGVDAVFGQPGAPSVAAVSSAAASAGDPFGGACRPVVTQPYGPTTFPGEPIVNGIRVHTGIDLACPGGTPVHTVTAGTAHVTLGWGGGFGNNVVVELVTQLSGDTVPHHYFVRYGHLAAVDISDGAAVHAGDLIGQEGSTGYSTGPHLHFEVDRDAASVQRSVNPSPLLTVV
jgi:murein DD-endopeptidase MepM/ murein hydrolase activator NlpD